MAQSRKKQIRDLKEKWNKLEWDIAEAMGSSADPDMKGHYISDLQYAQFIITDKIEELEHEQGMLPLQLMLAGFIIFVVGMFIYFYS